MVSILDILSGRCSPIVDVRQSGVMPFLGVEGAAQRLLKPRGIEAGIFLRVMAVRHERL